MSNEHTTSWVGSLCICYLGGGGWWSVILNAQGAFVKGLSSKILTNSIIVCMILLKGCNGKGQHDNKDIQNRYI